MLQQTGHVEIEQDTMDLDPTGKEDDSFSPMQQMLIRSKALVMGWAAGAACYRLLRYFAV